MLGRICKIVRKWKSSSQKNQVVSQESVHGESLAAKWVACDHTNCLEANKTCTCHPNMIPTSNSKIVVHAEANSSFAHAVINMVGMLIGLGQLTTPYALENGGWLSVLMLVGLGIICAYTSHLLGKCLDKSPKSKTYSDIGEAAFGSTGKIIASCFIYLEIFMALVSYTISLHDNIALVFSGTNGISRVFSWSKLASAQLLTIIAVLVALPSLWLRNLSSVSFLSSGGILMSLLIFTCVALTSILGYVQSNHDIPLLHLQNIPSISGLYVFSFAGHIVFPNLYKSMKDPSKFTKVSIVSFSCVTILYTSLAFMGAKMFGPQVSAQITLSMPRNVIFTKIALWAVVLTPMTKYALEFAPFAIQLEHSLPKSLSPKMKMIIRASVGSIILLVILALALSFPYFQHVLGLTGSLVSVSICIVLPCVFYLKISWSHISKGSLILNVGLVVFGVVLGIVGTVSSSRLLILTLLKAHSTT
ncbi:Transmembrane amino acid transporter family protein [Euphorbia peplus]|nr:Transmembrane amino acid transporter family protein [Euphorbia peplus]